MEPLFHKHIKINWRGKISETNYRDEQPNFAFISKECVIKLFIFSSKKNFQLEII